MSVKKRKLKTATLRKKNKKNEKLAYGEARKSAKALAKRKKKFLNSKIREYNSRIIELVNW